jgi:ArsR family transcriptional regulator
MASVPGQASAGPGTASAQQQPFVQQPSQQSQSQSASGISSLPLYTARRMGACIHYIDDCQYRPISISYEPMTTDLDRDVRFLQALADPVRLSIIRQIAACNNAVCACDFVECCTVSQPTISHHLRVLRDAGVVTSERQGTNIIYSLAPDFETRWTGIGAGLKGLVALS